jgi:excisionase family DNA binding protein
MTDPNRRFRFFPQLLTVPEVAEILRVSPRTVRRMIDDKRLPVVRLGRAVRVRLEALAALIGETK